MSKEYTLKDKRDRNERLYRFRVKHPDMTLRAIGKVFHISHVRVLEILRKKEVEKS